MVGSSGYRLFCVSSVKDVEEIFTSKEEDIKIAERLFSSSLVAVVTCKESTKLKVMEYTIEINATTKPTLATFPHRSATSARAPKSATTTTRPTYWPCA